MPRENPPQPVVDLAEARAVARRARDWAAADRLRAEIEATGWKVIDTGTLYDLERAVGPDVVTDGVIRYGSSVSVPSRLGDEPVGRASVVMIATAWPEDLARAHRSLVERAPDGTQLVVVANGASAAQAAALDGLDAADPGAPGVMTEVLWTSSRLGHAAALNAGIRRAAAPVVIVLDTDVEPTDDLVSSLVTALVDETVAVAGPFGLVTDDLRRFDAPPAGAADVAAIAGAAMAFRRSDFVARGPLDEHFVTPAHLDTWWSLVLRDEAAADPDAGDVDRDPSPLRRAIQVGAGSVVRHPPHDPAAVATGDRDRLTRRNFYRVLKRFGSRLDLAVPAPGTSAGGGGIATIPESP